MVALGAPQSAEAQVSKKNPPLGISNVIQSVSVVNGGLVATTIQGQTIPIALAAQPAAGSCAILNLSLGPINLNLLGLLVQTSPICLDVTAQPEGGLLGNLLCGIANLLNGGTPLNVILGGLNAQETTVLTNGLRDLLNGALNNLNQAVLQSIQPAQANQCPILNLSLGPLHLNLLGLVVDLDNCNNGPVTVDLTAIRGGGLLGGLLCGIANLLNPGSTLQQILQQLLNLLVR